MKSHSVDVLALVFGLVFLGIAILWLVTQYATLSASGLGWTLAGVLIALGGIGIMYAISVARRRDPDYRVTDRNPD